MTGHNREATPPNSNATLPRRDATLPARDVTLPNRNATCSSRDATLPRRDVPCPRCDATVTNRIHFRLMGVASHRSGKRGKKPALPSRPSPPKRGSRPRTLLVIRTSPLPSPRLDDSAKDARPIRNAHLAKTRRTVLPLPGREGRGEGGRNSKRFGSRFH